MDGWDSLKRQLDSFTEKGVPATFWWRDDDACQLVPAFQRLVQLACDTHTPLALAVIPEGLSNDLPRWLDQSGGQVTVVQHGFSHKNHAPPDQKKQELTTVVGLDFLCSRLTAGRTRLLKAFPEMFGPVLVPPWNRIDEEVLNALPSLGFQGFSTFGDEEERWQINTLRQTNCHLDIFHWKPARAFKGKEAILHELVSLLAQRLREGGRRPIGILTHHLYHDEEVWGFLQNLLNFLQDHPAARLCGIEELFAVRSTRPETDEVARVS